MRIGMRVTEELQESESGIAALLEEQNRAFAAFMICSDDALTNRFSTTSIFLVHPRGSSVSPPALQFCNS
jgi:hypothetical protein